MVLPVGAPEHTLIRSSQPNVNLTRTDGNRVISALRSDTKVLSTHISDRGGYSQSQPLQQLMLPSSVMMNRYHQGRHTEMTLELGGQSGFFGTVGA